MEVVVLVFEEDFNPLRSCQKDGLGIFVDVGLQIQDGCGLVGFRRLLGHLESLLLQETAEWVVLELFLREEQRPDHVEVFKLQPLKQVRIVLVGSVGCPVLPDLVIVDGHLDLLRYMESQMLESIEKASVFGGLPRADPRE